jgi:hypothetical protein
MKYLMKLWVLSLCVSIGSISAIPVYKSVAIYAALTYGLLAEYERNHPGCSSDSVRDYLHGKAFNHIRSDAYNMGYSWRRVLKAAYRIGIDESVQRVPILEALNKETRSLMMWNDVKDWISVIGAGFSTAVSLVSIGCFFYYIKYDRQVVNHYRYGTLGGKFPRLYRD